MLDELERVLLDVAHSPQTVTPAQFKSIRQRIDNDGLLFKVRVLAKEIQQRENDEEAGAGTKRLGTKWKGTTRHEQRKSIWS